MIPTETRRARESGIKLCMSLSFGRKSSTARFDAQGPRKFHRSPEVS
jgi:hypothetical protein